MQHYELYSDEKLVLMYRKGDERAIECLINRHTPAVIKKATAMYIAGGERDDLIQEGMIGLLNAVRNYSAGKDASFKTFAYLCINSAMVNAIKAAKTKKNSPLNGYVSFDEPAGNRDDNYEMKLVDTLTYRGNSQNPEKLYIDNEAAAGIKAEINKNLSPLERNVIALYMAGNDYMEIAEIMGRSPKSIDNALQRARNKVDKIIHL